MDVLRFNIQYFMRDQKPYEEDVNPIKLLHYLNISIALFCALFQTNHNKLFLRYPCQN